MFDFHGRRKSMFDFKTRKDSTSSISSSKSIKLFDFRPRFGSSSSTSSTSTADSSVAPSRFQLRRRSQPLETHLEEPEEKSTYTFKPKNARNSFMASTTNQGMKQHQATEETRRMSQVQLSPYSQREQESYFTTSAHTRGHPTSSARKIHTPTGL